MNCPLNHRVFDKPRLIVALTTCLVAFAVGARAAFAAEIKVAVSSNFYPTLQIIAKEFERETGNTLVAITGSTGKHYAQIVNGAPFDIFLAADRARPEALFKSPRFANADIKNYAVGRLALWAPKAASEHEVERLLHESFDHLAIANPRLAPYGVAAQQVLEGLGLMKSTHSKWVMGENVTQTFQFVASGNADLGFVAESQILLSREQQQTDFWIVPNHLHAPIEQAAVLLSDSATSVAFYEYLSSEAALEIIRSHGYDNP